MKRYIHSLVDNIYRKEDVDAILKSIHDSENSDEFDEVAKDIWCETKIDPHDIDEEDIQNYEKEAVKLLTFLDHKKKLYIRRFITFTSAAAAILFITFMGIEYFSRPLEISYVSESTSFGEKKNIILPDGTRIYLNSCSSIRYPEQFIAQERRVELNGEGCFEVTKDPEHPFIVQTPKMKIRVLGTVFNVKTYPEDDIARVNVESGKVQVDLPDAMVKLKANEEAIINTEKGDLSKCSNTKKGFALWRNGKMHFDNTPIVDVAKELERVYGCHIVFSKDYTFNNCLSGVHENRNLTDVLKSIEYTTGIHYNINKKQIFFYK